MGEGADGTQEDDSGERDLEGRLTRLEARVAALARLVRRVEAELSRWRDDPPRSAGR